MAPQEPKVWIISQNPAEGGILRKKREKTPENDAKLIVDKTYDKYWSLIPTALRKAGGRANAEKLEEFLGKMYIEDYMTHKINPVLLPILADRSEISNQPFYKRKFNERMNLFAKRQADKLKRKNKETDLDYETRKKQKITDRFISSRSSWYDYHHR